MANKSLNTRQKQVFRAPIVPLPVIRGQKPVVRGKPVALHKRGPKPASR